MLMQLLLTENAEENLTSLLKAAGNNLEPVAWALIILQVSSGIKINEFTVLVLSSQVLPTSKSPHSSVQSCQQESFLKGLSESSAVVSPITVGE